MKSRQGPGAKAPSPAAVAGAPQARSGASGAVVDSSPALLSQRGRMTQAFGAMAQLAAVGEEERMQGRFDAGMSLGAQGGLPAPLQRGIQAMSGMDMSGVRVHANSARPAQLNAHAFAQGNDIHLAPGQDRHLPHEAWHVVQQRQGRVRPTLQAKGVPINDDRSLEREADSMGAKALRTPGRSLRLSADHGAQLAALGSGGVSQLQAGRFLLDEGQPAQEGQIGKSEFLEAMRTKVLAVSKEVLGPFGMAQDDCPDLKYWVGHYEGKDAAYVEGVIARYAPASQGAGNCSEYLDALVQRIRQGLVEHTRTGAQVDPEPIPDSIDKQRPPLSVFGIQKMDAGVAQLGCGSSASTQTREPEKAVQHDAKSSVAEVKADAPAEKHTIDVIKARASRLRELYAQGPTKHAEIRAELWEHESATTRRLYKTEQNYCDNFLDGCSGAAAAMAQYVVGKEVLTKAKDGTSLALLVREGHTWKLNPLLAEQGNGHYHMSLPENRPASHHFTIIALGGKYDLYESDFNLKPVVVHFLFGASGDGVGRSQSAAELSFDGLRDRLVAVFRRCKIDMDTEPSVSVDQVFTPSA
jgi:hypothetical protein